MAGGITTTMMWIEGVSPLEVIRAFLPAAVALAVFNIPASLRQQRFSPIVCDPPTGLDLDWVRVAVVSAILGIVIATNVVVNMNFPDTADQFPFLGVAAWGAILVMTPVRAPDWKIVRPAAVGSLFLLALVLGASMMPVESLPDQSRTIALGLGFVSSVFDNIPLTKLALEQGGYDWGALAYAVGFGGFMVWFGSSAGVAIATQFPYAKSVTNWLAQSWHVPLGYVAGFAVYLAVFGWIPSGP